MSVIQAICNQHAPKLLLLFALLVPGLAGCAPFPGEKPHLQSETVQEAAWTYADLRLLDPSDADQPENDLLAVYLRRPAGSQPSWIDIRLDFLEISMRNQPDIYVALDYRMGGKERLPNSDPVEIRWDALLKIRSSGAFEAQFSSGQPVDGLSVRILRDPELDSLSIRFDASALYAVPGSGAPPEMELQVYVLQADSSQVADRTAVFASFSPPPPPAPLLLAYWNTYPAYTPAQALRRWDGAHTGPLGGRHGLSNLLRTASNAGVPVALLDLKYPSWLSALDYAGDLERVKNISRRGLLLLPEYLPPVDDPILSDYSQSLTRRFNLPGSPFAYTQSADYIPYYADFILVPERLPNPVASIQMIGGQRRLPIPVDDASLVELQPDLSGLSLEARRLLIDVALRGEGREILVLGGDLTRSTWGSPQVARAALQYIRSHLWIHPLGAADLLAMPPDNSPARSSEDDQPVFATLPQDEGLLHELPQQQLNPLVSAAAQAYLASAAPATPYSSAFAALQEIYTNQNHILLSAARWAQQPVEHASCDEDFDQDNQLECVLASKKIYAVFDPTLGILTHVFALLPGGVQQLIAPSSQFTFGTGDVAAWQPNFGLAADPQVIPGAFYDGGGPYQARIIDRALVLRDPLSGLEKTFSLLPTGLRVEYRDAMRSTRLPLALDPWVRFEPGWADYYQASELSGGWSLKLADKVGVEVQSSRQVQPFNFKDTQLLMDQVENPNTEFPPGHYLLFPMAVLEFSGDPDFWLEIRITP